MARYNTYYKIEDETVIVAYDNTRKDAVEIANLYYVNSFAIQTPNGSRMTAVGVMNSNTGKIYRELPL